MHNWKKICLLCLLFSHFQYSALGDEEDWQMFSGRKNVPFEEIKAEVYKDIEDIARTDRLKDFFLAYAKTTLEPNCIEISFRKKSETDGTLIYRGKIYFSKGRLFINYDYIDEEWLRKDQGNEGHNYATVNGNLYRWKYVGHNSWKCRFHKHKGEVLRRYHGDTLSYLPYFIDRSGIKSCEYRDYVLGDYPLPERIKAVKKDGMIDIRTCTQDSNGSTMDPNDKRKVLYSVIIGEAHPWLFSYSEPGYTTLEFDCPKVIKEIPKSVLKLPNNIDFDKCEYTVDRYMVFL
jgi:hypothetical protein